MKNPWARLVLVVIPIELLYGAYVLLILGASEEAYRSPGLAGALVFMVVGGFLIAANFTLKIVGGALGGWIGGPWLRRPAVLRPPASLVAILMMAVPAGTSGQADSLGFEATLTGGLVGEWHGCAEVASNLETMHVFLEDGPDGDRTIEFGLSLNAQLPGAVPLVRVPSMSTGGPAEWVREGKGYGLLFSRPDVYEFVDGTVTVHRLASDLVGAEFEGVLTRHLQETVIAEVRGEFLARRDSTFSAWVYRPSSRVEEPRPARPRFCGGNAAGADNGR